MGLGSQWRRVACYDDGLDMVPSLARLVRVGGLLLSVALLCVPVWVPARAVAADSHTLMITRLCGHSVKASVVIASDSASDTDVLASGAFVVHSKEATHSFARLVLGYSGDAILSYHVWCFDDGGAQRLPPIEVSSDVSLRNNATIIVPQLSLTLVSE